MQNLTHLSLFSGIGGLDIAAEWAGFKTVGQCEWAEYPAKVLEKHWPDVPRWKDIRTLTGESFYERTGLRTVDIISGGFPCQPFSVAGKQRGKEDDRYLWPEMVRVIKELRPTWVVGENVAGIVRMALPDILSELEACGYATRAFLIPACAVGARHRRYRVAIVGHAKHDGLSTAKKPRSAGEAGKRSEEGEETASEFEGTGEPGNSENVGRAEVMENTGCGRCGEQEDVCEQPGRTEFKRSGKVMADTESVRQQGEWPAGSKSAEHDRKHGNLKDIVMYATPQSRDYRTDQASRWQDTEHRSRNLNDQIAMYPTPTTGAGLCGGTGNFQQLKKLEADGVISEKERRNMSQGNGGQLNPYWVEWLMGFPIGWTEI